MLKQVQLRVDLKQHS